MAKISAVVVNRNEAKQLDKCLSSLHGFANEIVVIDLDSCDNSKHIAKKHQAKVISQQPVPIVEHIRQQSLKYATHNYVFIIDPDEVAPPKLKTELKLVLQDEPDYIEIPRKNIVFNKWIKYSRWWPDYQVRLFKKNKVSWPKEIHSQPVLEGQGYTLPAKEEFALIHHNYQNLTEYFQKNIRYAQSEALYYLQNKKTLTLKETVRRSTAEFISRFFAGHGFKDGTHGLVLSVLQFFYYFLVYFFYWEAGNYKPEIEETELINQASNLFSRTTKELIHWKNEIGKASVKERIVQKLL